MEKPGCQIALLDKRKTGWLDRAALDNAAKMHGFISYDDHGKYETYTRKQPVTFCQCIYMHVYYWFGCC